MAKQIRNSKFRKMYGYTLKELAVQWGVSPYKAYVIHLEEQRRKNATCPHCGKHLYYEAAALPGRNH